MEDGVGIYALNQVDDETVFDNEMVFISCCIYFIQWTRLLLR